MPVVLQVEFPWGKYHATEWGRNVNEGQPEWPPSPWRVLRALFATWKIRCAHLGAEDVEAALSQLAKPPTFHLPDMRPAHLRHYMPQVAHRSFGPDKGKTTLAFDPFAVVDPRKPVSIEWDVELPTRAFAALKEIAASVSYLGRSESICRAELLSQVEHPAPELWQPAHSTDRVDSEVLCPQQPLELSSLIQSPDTVRKKRRIIPPGSHLVPYAKTVQAQTSAAANTGWPPTYAAVRLAVHPRPRPTIANAVAVGDLLRRAAMNKHRKVNKHQDPSETLSGKRPSGDYTLDGHRHAHYVSLPQDHRGDAAAPVDALVVWAPRRLNGDEFAALSQLKWLRAGRAASGVPDFAVAVNGFGEIGEIAPEIVGPASVWRSLTPFSPSRHPSKKISWSAHLQNEIERELSEYRSFPKPVSVNRIKEDTRRYRRYRLPPKETMDSSRRSSMVEIQFRNPVEGPIILGALCHFGLGLFLPVGTE